MKTNKFKKLILNCLFLIPLLFQLESRAENCLVDQKYQRLPGVYSLKVDFGSGRIFEDLLTIQDVCKISSLEGKLIGTFTIPGMFTTRVQSKIAGGIGMNLLNTSINVVVLENGNELPVILNLFLEKTGNRGYRGEILFIKTQEKFPIFMTKLVSE